MSTFAAERRRTLTERHKAELAEATEGLRQYVNDPAQVRAGIDLRAKHKTPAGRAWAAGLWLQELRQADPVYQARKAQALADWDRQVFRNLQVNARRAVLTEYDQFLTPEELKALLITARGNPVAERAAAKLRLFKVEGEA